jgi:hypothetical protein
MTDNEAARMLVESISMQRDEPRMRWDWAGPMQRSLRASLVALLTTAAFVMSAHAQATASAPMPEPAAATATGGSSDGGLSWAAALESPHAEGFPAAASAAAPVVAGTESKPSGKRKRDNFVFAPIPQSNPTIGSGLAVVTL